MVLCECWALMNNAHSRSTGRDVTVAVVSEVQFLNAQSPMLLTESGMAIVLSEEQWRNAPSPMLVTESGIVIVFSFLQ